MPPLPAPPLLPAGAALQVPRCALTRSPSSNPLLRPPTASAGHLLPTTNLQQPSPLLNAPRAGNWTEVRGTPRLPRDAGDDLQPRIINGEADPDLIAFPYIAYMDRVLGDEVFSCTGSLVGPSHVLTAAHCVVSEADGSVASPGDVTVWVDGTWHDVAAVYAHSSEGAGRGGRCWPALRAGPALPFGAVMQAITASACTQCWQLPACLPTSPSPPLPLPLQAMPAWRHPPALATTLPCWRWPPPQWQPPWN